MNKKYLFLQFLLVLMLTGCSTTRNLESLRQEQEAIALKHSNEVNISTTLKPLPVGEVLTYTIKYMGIHIGEMKTSVKGIEKVEGKDAYVLEMTAKTNSFFSKIYKIRDRYVSYLDVEKLRVVRTEIYRREGGYRKDAVTVYNHEEGKAYYQNLNRETDKKVIDIPEKVHDAITVNYFFRMIPLRLGDMVAFNIYQDEKIYELFGTIKKTVKINIPKKGRKEVFVFQPYAKLEGDLVKIGKGVGYFSTDENRRPYMGKVKSPIIGSAAFIITDIKEK